jgi:hypothetical protein
MAQKAQTDADKLIFAKGPTTLYNPMCMLVHVQQQQQQHEAAFCF